MRWTTWSDRIDRKTDYYLSNNYTTTFWRSNRPLSGNQGQNLCNGKLREKRGILGGNMFCYRLPESVPTAWAHFSTNLTTY